MKLKRDTRIKLQKASLVTFGVLFGVMMTATPILWDNESTITGALNQTDTITQEDPNVHYEAEDLEYYKSSYDNLKEVVIDNRTGFYFYDDESFVNRLAFILNMSDTEKNKIIAAAKENNDQLFSIDKYAERMEKVYEKAIREHW